MLRKITVLLSVLALAACTTDSKSESDESPSKTTRNRPPIENPPPEPSSESDPPQTSGGQEEAHGEAEEARGEQREGSGGQQQASGEEQDSTGEQVEFESGERTLRGTLHRANRSKDDPGPAVVLVHGSGPLSRDEAVSGQFLTHFGFEIPVFEELARGLADAGYVVLRYDKRTCVGANNPRCTDNEYPAPGDDPTIEDFVGDAARAVEWLRRRPFVDDDRLVVLGHSQGASFVPKLMEEDESIYAGVMVAAPYRPVDETYRAQAEFMWKMLKKSGMPESRIKSMKPMKRIDGTADKLEKLRAGEYENDRLAGASVEFWQSWMKLGDEVPNIAAELDRPLLVLSGSYDYNVPPKETKLWRENLESESAAADHEVVVLECITHALNCIDEPDAFEVKPSDLGKHVDDKVIDRIARFLDDRR